MRIGDAELDKTTDREVADASTLCSEGKMGVGHRKGCGADGEDEDEDKAGKNKI